MNATLARQVRWMRTAVSVFVGLSALGGCDPPYTCRAKSGCGS
jgi:hypothetical protein